jgi:putative ABC transport system ATP-binding protein
MHILAGLDRPTSGFVEVDGNEIGALSDQQLTVLRRRRVGFVFQSFNLIPTLTVAGNVRLPFDLDGRRPTSGEQAWIDALLERLGLADRLDHRPHELSGGQQQRVAVARALATRPAILFADEPTGSLDARTGRDLLKLLAASAEDSGQTIAMVTHDPIAAGFASRVVFLADGRIVSDTGRLSAEEIARRALTWEDAA